MNEIYETALKWVVQGYAVIPIQYASKRPDARLLPDGKWEPFKTQLPSIEMLQRWFPGRLHNLGLVMGWGDLVVVDFDLWDAYVLWEQIAGIKTFKVKTNRGMHVYFKLQEKTPNIHNDFLDIKANGYVLVPPSVHPTGSQYYVYEEAPIASVGCLKDILPEELLVNAKNTEYQSVPVSVPVYDDPWARIDNAIEITDDLADKVRAHYRVEDFFPSAQESSGNGRWRMDKCPFHDDKHPSFWLDVQRQICGCHAGCTPKPLDVINLYARLHGLTNRDAILIMAKGL